MQTNKQTNRRMDETNGWAKNYMPADLSMWGHKKLSLLDQSFHLYNFIGCLEVMATMANL